MRLGKQYLGFLFLLAVAIPAAARLKDIHTDKLPDNPAVRNAYAQLGPLESMARAWQPNWHYKTPKSDVADQVNASLKALKEAAKAAPDNEELLLLVGLAANYSYNLDAEESHEVAVESFKKAQKLAPQDYRPRWFLGLLQCQTNAYLEGMKRFLALEDSMSWQQLPATFWDDYMECAIISNMPAHALRAGAHANQLDPQATPDRAALLDGVSDRFVAPDPKATYTAKDVWSSENSGSETVFSSVLFGLRFSASGQWGTKLPDVEKAIGVAQFETGPYKGVSDMVIPNILVLVRPAKAGETLQDFLLAMTKKHKGSATSAPACPVHDCLALTATEPGGYKQDGDAHMFVTAFQREAPEFPGLTFEEPTALPQMNDGKVHSFHAAQHLQRLPGTLYYLVLLDTAGSVLEEAKKDYIGFLKTIQVE